MHYKIRCDKKFWIFFKKVFFNQTRSSSTPNDHSTLPPVLALSRLVDPVVGERNAHGTHGVSAVARTAAHCAAVGTKAPVKRHLWRMPSLLRRQVAALYYSIHYSLINIIITPVAQVLISFPFSNLLQPACVRCRLAAATRVTSLSTRRKAEWRNSSRH